MIKNIVFDFGQVLIHFDPFYITERYVKDKEDIILLKEAIFDRIWFKLDEDAITDDEFKTEICSFLPERLQSKAIEIYDNWYFNLPLIEGMYEVLSNLKKEGKNLYLLSNISRLFANNYHKNPDVLRILDLFDGYVFSGEIGLVKPNAEIYDYITQKYNLSKNETLFIDDNELNIKGAENFGIKGYLFDGDAQKLMEYLKQV